MSQQPRGAVGALAHPRAGSSPVSPIAGTAAFAARSWREDSERANPYSVSRKNGHGCLIHGGGSKPCYAHATPGCTLIAHRSPAGQRIDFQPRCVRCGRVMSLTRHPDDQPCDSCADSLPPSDTREATR